MHCIKRAFYFLFCNFNSKAAHIYLEAKHLGMHHYFTNISNSEIVIYEWCVLKKSGTHSNLTNVLHLMHISLSVIIGRV